MYHPNFYRAVSLVALRVCSNLLSRRGESHERKGEKGRGGKRKKEKEKKKSPLFSIFAFQWYESKAKFQPTCECGDTKRQTAASSRF